MRNGLVLYGWSDKKGLYIRKWQIHKLLVEPKQSARILGNHVTLDSNGVTLRLGSTICLKKVSLDWLAQDYKEK